MQPVYGMEEFTNLTLWCAKLHDNRQIIFMSKETDGNKFFNKTPHNVIYPLQGGIGKTGDFEFEQYVEFSDCDVMITLYDLRSISKPMPQIEGLYAEFVRRLEFLKKHPEKSKSVLERTNFILGQMKEDGKEVTMDDYRQQLAGQIDEVILEFYNMIDTKPEVVIDVVKSDVVVSNVIPFNRKATTTPV